MKKILFFLSKTTIFSTFTTKMNPQIKTGTPNLSTGPSKTVKRVSYSETCNKETIYLGWKSPADLYYQQFNIYSLFFQTY